MGIRVVGGLRRVEKERVLTVGEKIRVAGNRLWMVDRGRGMWNVDEKQSNWSKDEKWDWNRKRQKGD